MSKKQWVLRRTEEGVSLVRYLRTPSGLFAGERMSLIPSVGADRLGACGSQVRPPGGALH